MKEDTKTEDLWTPYKNLYLTISYYLCEDGKNENPAGFEDILRKHKQSFYALLQNPPKNSKSREELKKGMEDGITMKEIGHQVLSKDLYQEAIILSDMYNLNEFVALDLLCTAQMQMPFYYGLPRGLVAVLLYYDGRKCIASSLRLLVQARRGVSWSFNTSTELTDYVTNFTNQLIDNGLFNRIFELLHTLDLSKEIDKLQENVALGGPRHRKQVIDLFNDIRYCLAEIVFLWAAQTGIPREPTVSLINCLRQLKIEEDSSGSMDNVTFYLLMALLSAIDLSIIHIRDDGEHIVQSLPILADKEYIPMLCTELSPSKPKWVSEGLQAMSTFALSVTCASLRLVPQNSLIQSTISKEMPFFFAAIDMKIFDFMKNKFLCNEMVYTDEILQRRIHCLLTDFIVQMFPHVKEMQMKAKETACLMQAFVREGLEPPPHLSRYFETFMEVVTQFYSKDPLNLHYSLEFWFLEDAQSFRTPPRSMVLSKFVKMIGESVPSLLFVPYLNMLSSLSSSQPSAKHCFNMLKQTSFGYNNTVSWDHFFMSFNQYYNNLKQEIGPTTDTMYRRAVHHKGITPQEIQGLHAVLKLIRTIAEYDDFSRLALCEHPGWAPLNILLGLVSCSVPISIKADLLLTLAALSKSPETALQTWNNIEASQILNTVPTTSSYQPRGIQTEIDEIESRMEEYPLTQALLKLLDVLTDSGIPRTLGAGPRRPGFDPYLTFIVNSVFLKFNFRSYKHMEERWIIAATCLKLLSKFLSQYEPQGADFAKTEFNSPPGYHLMLQLNSKSEFLNLILLIMEECLKLFLQCISFPGQTYVEDCSVKCLNILERALALQTTFSKLASVGPCPVLLTNLNKLLLIINPRTGQPDHCLNISKYIGLQYFLPQHALVACKVLLNVTSFPTLHAQYLNILLSNEKESKLIRSGFVECLDAVLSKDDGESLTMLKETILKLLKQCLSYSAPNLTHFLLGFDLKHDISQTLFQNPGVLDFPRTCLHSIFTILKSAVSKELQSVRPTLLESTYHMLYLLSSNFKTSTPVLRFLRQNQKFFQEHLTLCANTANEGVSELNQLSWLLKTLAIELKISCTRTQVFYLQQLCSMLVEIPESTKDDLLDPFSVSHNSNLSKLVESKDDKLLVALINKFDLYVEEVVTPRWDYFDHNMLNALIKNCETDTNPKLIDVRKLHHMLIDEIGSLHANAAVGQRQAIMQEMQKVLLHALNINNTRNSALSIVKFVDAWRQVVEVVAVYMPFHILSTTEQQILNISVLENVCSKTANVQLLPEVAVHLSGLVVMLLEKICRCHVKEQQHGQENDTFINVVHANNESLKLILNYLVKWIMNTDGFSQNIKINLYAALATFLRLVHLDEPVQGAKLDSSFYISRLDSSKLQASKDLTTFYIPSSVFSSFGPRLIELICNDCIGGHDVVKMLAMTTFSLLISMSGNVNWLMHLAGRGYLKHIIDSILNSDQDLQQMLEPEPRSLRPLFVYISKMSLLSQCATTKVGCELVLEQSLLSCLSNMRVFQVHPEVLKQTQLPPDGFESFIPSIENRYIQIFLPTLHLCNTIVTTLSSENRSAVSQILFYLLNNLDVVEFVLRSGTPLLSQNFLEELAVLTSIIARTAKSDMTYIHERTDGLQDNRSRLYRIQKLILALFPKFVLSKEVIRDLLLNPQDAVTFQTSQRLLLAFQIISNLTTYARNIITNNDVGEANIYAIFHPSLGNTFIGFNSKATEKSHNLGIIVEHLVTTVNYYHEEKTMLDFLQIKVNEIPAMSSTDLKKLMKLPEVHDLGATRENALEFLNDKLNKKKQEFEHCSFIIENLLYVLWSHIDYYMLRAIPKIRKGELPNLSGALNLNVTLASASEATWRVSTDDISNLKHGLVSIFNDSFSRQLVATTTGQSDVNKHFVEILLRKIKRLIQFVPVK
ncbi:hypothetical protein RN001_009887 [Aquatica leii]|uniref:Nuclear pore complex protein Nup205 n=1 Tax=Aquatica leii TaxID=1421715 RepID=A0AAN7S8C1_9COLE|nr:hypothetical protein RN001_009887 [Aquatica leii]